MSERIYRKLELSDLQMLVSTNKEADALEIWQIDEESARVFVHYRKNKTKMNMKQYNKISDKLCSKIHN